LRKRLRQTIIDRILYCQAIYGSRGGLKMKERIDIIVPRSALDQNEARKLRLEKTHRFEPTDRAPVVTDFQVWALLAGSEGRFSEFTNGPRSHLRRALLNLKWRMENVPDDLPIETDCLRIEPQFGAIRGTEFPIEIEWIADSAPKSRHLLNEIEQIDDLQIPPPDGGLNKVRIDYYKAMSDMVSDFDVRLNGTPLNIKIDLTHPGGPIPSAFALCGSNLFLWMKLDPDRMHRLLDIVTESHLQVIAYFDELTGREPGHSVWAGADIAEMVSPKMFREFVIPYYLRMWERQDYPRVYHMCGNINHIMDMLHAEMDITFLDRFGFPADPDLLAKNLSGRVVMRGGPHPGLIHDGPVEKIIDICMDYIQVVGCRGGYILSDGVGIMPGTPMNHIEAMVEASRRVGWAGNGA